MYSKMFGHVWKDGLSSPVWVAFSSRSISLSVMLLVSSLSETNEGQTEAEVNHGDVRKLMKAVDV